MSTSRLRRPNFNLLPFVPTASSLSSSSSPNDAPSSSLSRIAVAAAIGGGGGTTTTTAAAVAASDPSSSSSRQLANYARRCHERILLNSNDREDDDTDDRGEDDGTRRRRDDGGGCGEDDDVTRRRRIEEEGPSMERCIALLEPILGSFVSACIANDEKRARRMEKSGTSSDACVGGRGGKTGDLGEDDDDDDDDDDEVPPQLTRVARFFPQRFVPMRRALLRPIPTSGVVELALHYRLRLAKACFRRGLVADAEYEALRMSFDRSRDKRKGRRGGDDGDDDDYDDDDIHAGVVKKTKRQKAESGNDNTDEDGDDDDAALMERVRLSLMRLPADAASSSSSTSRGRSAAAWRHVVELLSRCRSRWEEEDDIARSDDGDCDDRRVVDPDRVADWAMTSWTVMTLMRGGPDRIVPPRRVHIGGGGGTGGDFVDHRGRCLDPIEVRLAALLSDRKDGDVPSVPPASMATTGTTVACAVGRRIDSLLSPANISSLNGVHLYSLGRLLASFRVRDDAIVHFTSSICRCGATVAATNGAGGGGNLVGLEPLSRLLAVYVWCFRASLSSATLATATRSISSVVRELDIDLRAKLEDDGFMRTIVVEHGGGVGMGDLRATEKMVQQQHHSMTLARRRAISFLDAMLSATAHLLKCCDA